MVAKEPSTRCIVQICFHFAWVDQAVFMSHTALLPLPHSMVLCFIDEKHKKLVTAWKALSVES